MKRSLWLVCAMAGCTGGSVTPAWVQSVVPARGAASGGQPVVIKGGHFGTSPAVKIGGLPARVTRSSDVELTVLTPRRTAGPATIEVDTGDSVSSLDAGFLYEPITLGFVDAAAARLTPFPVDGAGVAITDADQDGDLDVIQAGRAEGVWFYENSGAGAFSAPHALAVGPADGGAGFPVGAVVAADFDGDGKVDLFLGTRDRAPAQVLIGNGKWGFTARALSSSFGLEQTAIAADLDGDGDLDLIAMGSSPTADGAAQVQLLFNDGRGGFEDRTAERLAGAAFDAPGAAAGDFDGDSKLDLFFSGTTAPNRLYLGDGHGAFARAAPDALPIDSAPNAGVPAAGDLDGDGHLDLFVPTATQDRVLFGDGAGHFDDVSTLYLGAENGKSARALLRDLDLDGHLDVVVVDRPGRARLYRNDGTGRLFDYSAELAGNTAGPVTADVAVGDLDGDGDDDFFVSRPDVSRPALFVNWAPKLLSEANQDDDRFPDPLDNCPAVTNPDQVSSASAPFGCTSNASCVAATGCELGVKGDSAYLICRNSPQPWATAKAKCAARGGTLASISSPEENAFLAARDGGQTWVGLTDQAVEGAWVWASGEPLGFAAWAPGQADGGPAATEDCAALLGTTRWNDENCTLAKGFVCETARVAMPMPGDACRAIPDGGI